MNTPTEHLTISIVTPAYNQVQYIEKTIMGVIGQHYPDLEYIIIDGGSKDGSVEILNKHEKTVFISDDGKRWSD
jgi:glycosyltransferase involved in cell wall biosynthesis